MIMGLPLGERDNSSIIVDHATAACPMTGVAANPIDRLIREMSLAEKLGQLTMTAAGSTVTGPTIAGDSTEAIRAGTIGNLLNLTGAAAVRDMQRLAVEESRLGIPLLIGFDVVHGYRTLFPIPLGEAAAFDPDLWALTAREAAKEAAADGLAMTFAPMLDVARDPRWGRSAEGPGEDPYVGMRLADAKVRGFQGVNLSDGSALAACAKHYCAYGAVTAGRDYASVDISERTLREVYLPPFTAAVAAGVASVMPAFTDLAGIPMTANAALLKGWLRRRLGFNGVIVSDYNAVAELINHGIAADLAQAATLALKAGVDIDMMANAYRHGLPIALDRGWVSSADIDESVRRVLTLKWKLGLFDDPYRRGSTAESAEAVETRRRFSRAVATRSVVMLKNDRDVLPFPSAIRIAVIGPLADAAGDMRGPWWGAATPEGYVSVVAGLKAAMSEARVAFEAGIDVEGVDVAGGMGRALDLCAQAEAIVLCLGEAATMSGEAASRAHPHLPGRQRQFAEAVFDRARALRKPVIVILFSGRPLIVPWLIERADAVLGQRARRRNGRPSEPERAHARDLGSQRRTDSALFRRAPQRPSSQPHGYLYQQVPRCTERSPVSLRIRTYLRAFSAIESQREPRQCDRERHRGGACGRDQRGDENGRRDRVSVRSRQAGERRAPGPRAQRVRQDPFGARPVWNRHLAFGGERPAFSRLGPGTGVRAGRSGDSRGPLRRPLTALGRDASLGSGAALSAGP
jgi:beta-glucosidase